MPAQTVYRGKLAACRYFYRWELPRIDRWLGLLNPVDRTPLDVKVPHFPSRAAARHRRSVQDARRRNSFCADQLAARFERYSESVAVTTEERTSAYWDGGHDRGSFEMATR